MVDEPQTTRRSAGLSILAVVGTLAIIVGSISLGVYGPRMGQRGTRIAGEPLSVLRNEVAQLYEVAVTATRRDADEDPETVARDAISEVFGPDVPVPDLTAEGCRLEGAMALAVADHRSVWLRYRQTSSRFPAMILLVSDPHDLFHFDVLGRHLPLMPGVRVEEELEWPFMAPVPRAGLVIRAMDGYAVVIVASPPERAVEIEEAILPIESKITSEIEVVAGILEAPGMQRPM